MGLFDGVTNFVKSGVSELMIARPDNVKHLLCYKHTLQNVRTGSQLTVDSDEWAVFFKDGRVVGVLEAGRHTLTTQNFPFLGMIVDKFTGGNLFIAEVFFVKRYPLRGVLFGGNTGMMRDPQLQVLVTARYNGAIGVQVVDPVQFVIAYAGQAGGADNEQIVSWIRGQFLNGVKQTIADFCIKQKITLLEMGAYTNEFSQSFLANTPALANIGIRVIEVGQFDIVFDDKDRAKLEEANARLVERLATARVDVDIERINIEKSAALAQQKQYELDQKYNQDARYVQNLAGNYQNYAAGQAVMGAGQGMATHGVGDGGFAGLGAQVAIGANIGGAMAGSFQNQPQFQVGQPQQPPAPQQTGGVATCSKCGTRQPPGKFCGECGTALAAAKKFCTGCAQELVPPTVKFCGNCGTSTAAPAPGGPA